MALSVPDPVLSQDGSPANDFNAAKPFNLFCGPVLFADGTPLSSENALEFSFLLYRETQAGITEVWDEEKDTWASQTPQPKPSSLFAVNGKWQSILVAIGQKDKVSGDPKFATDRLTRFPKYSAQCFFKGRDAAKMEQSGESSNSQSVEIVAFGEDDRAGLTINPTPAQQATHISLFLKDGSLTERGRILIEEESGGFVIELKANGASVKVTGQGEILLAPASGRNVRLTGDLSVTGNLSVAGLVNGITVP